ncbi:MAG: P-loop NTPase [Halobacteriales archaeon]|nr:P-loop NTPase [Halobacteriales archaeon]
MVGQVVAVASGKGGVGKTTTVVNLGVVLRRAEHSVVLVDADLGMANLGPMLGISGEPTLHDVLAGTASLEEALVEEAPGFAVLPGSDSLTDYPSADPRNLGDVLESLAEEFDFVLVDTGAGMSHEDVLPLGLADRVVLVASPDPAAIGDTRKTAELAGLARGDIAGLVVTKADEGTDAAEVAAQVGVDLLGVIPYDVTVRKSTASGRPLEAVDTETPAAVAYRALADTLVDGSADPLRGSPSAEELGAGSADAPSPEPEPEVDTAPGAEQADEATTSTAPEAPVEPGEEPEVEPPDPATPAAPEGEEAAEPTAATPDDGPEPASADEPGDDAEESADDVDEPRAEERDDDMTAADAAEPADANDEEDAGDTEAEEEEDPLAEFEDDEPTSKGGVLSRFGRLFR